MTPEQAAKKQHLTEAVEILAQRFGVEKPIVDFSNRRGGYYKVAARTILVSTGLYLNTTVQYRSPLDTIIHEFAHHVTFEAERRLHPEWARIPNPRWQWSPHGQEFREFLMKGVRFLYGEGNEHKYAWSKEYIGVARWGERELKRKFMQKESMQIAAASRPQCR